MKFKDTLKQHPEQLKKFCHGIDKILQPLTVCFDISFFPTSVLMLMENLFL